MPRDAKHLFVLAPNAMKMTQAEFGEAIGASRRTVQRWVDGRPPSYAVPDIVRALHPHDPQLAAEFAAAYGKTLADVGIRPPAPASPSGGGGAAVVVAPPPDASVDAVVCACSEAMEMTPAAVRPGLLAAFDRTAEIGLSCAQVARVLRARLAPPDVPSKKSKG
jgi:hypothetical protein